VFRYNSPARYANYDSWWYHKGEGLGVKDWTPLPEVRDPRGPERIRLLPLKVFPAGLESLYSATGWKVAAHNRSFLLPPTMQCHLYSVTNSLVCSAVPLCRYWAPDNVYSENNGGQYRFLTERGNLRWGVF
jgi:hypothetical protein